MVSGGGSSGSGGVGTSGTTSAGGSGGAQGSGGATGSGSATGSGGATAAGGTTTSGGATGSGGGTATGGVKAAGGATGTGGVSGTGGTSSTAGTTGTGGRTGTGGVTATGGATATGGTTGTGGATATGGIKGTGGATSTGGSTGGFSASFYIGADITDQETAPSAAQDDLLSQMKAHGFNSIRLRTFVDPKAADGYDKTNGYDDIAHTVVFGKKIKDAGMGLLVDFHYSDNWADPGKQCVPVAWQSYTTIADLATAVHDYTKDAITKLIAGGARPDMVQIGNETTPGMLIHRCDSGGQPTGNNPITGSTSNWTNLGALLKAGVQGVRDVDTGIFISFHIDRGNSFSATKSWIDNVVKQGISFDAFGESCYQQYQGDPNSTSNTVNGWTSAFGSMASTYPNIKFFAAEYGPLEREINDVLYNLPNKQGIGTFNWEPTTRGAWNQTADGVYHTLFTRSGNTYTTGADITLYDQMKIDYASRL